MGTDHLLTGAEPCRAYSRDETEALRFRPEAVVLPATAGEVQKVLEITSAAGVPVTPRGAGTGLSGGALAVEGGVVLSLERLTRIRDIDPQDMVAVAEVGVITETLRRRAEEEGLFYPPDPSSSDQCTLGGNLAEDAAGPRSLGYGSTRHHVLGLEAVLPDGRFLRTGGRNRKDVAGYDLTRLLVGSEGTLAVITAAILRLQARPRETLSLLAPFPDLDSAAEAVATVCRETPELVACELLEREAVETVARVQDVPDGLRESEALLFFELHGPREDVVLDAAARLDETIRSLGGGELEAARSSRDQRRLWNVRRSVGTAVRRRSVYKACDSTVPRSRLADLVKAARRVAAEHGLVALCYGHAGDGNLHVNLLREDLDDDTWKERRDAAEGDLLEEIVGLGGTITGEHGVGFTQRRYLEMAIGSVALGLMRELKSVFDPGGLLNPGKIFPDPSHP